MTKFLRTLRQQPLRWLLLGLPLLNSSAARAQVSAYTFAASSGTFTPLPAAATDVPTILADETTSPVITLPFAFVFDGTPYTSVKASTNGFLTFNAASGSNLSNNLATATATSRPLLAPLWDDLDGRPVGATARASYQTTGTAPNRVFTFEWLNYEWAYTANVAVISFQAKLYEGTNRIEFVYRPEANAPAGGVSASIGLASDASSGCTGEFLSLNNTSVAPVASSTVATNTLNTPPAAGQTYSFTPPPPPTGSCAAVRCANTSGITGTAANLNFIGNSSATSYTVTYQATGGALQTLTATASPVALSGLTLNTTYTATVRANCASGPAPVVTLTFTTSNGYCVSGAGGVTLGGVCGGNNVTDVSIVGTTLAATGLTCNNPVAGTAYTNYPTAPPTTGTVLRGETYPISVTTTGNSIVSAWIDFNHDFVFDATEWVQVATTTVAGTAAVASIVIPNTVAGAMPPTYNGPTGFRVRSRASGNPNGAANACTQFFSGETKDFTITLAPEPPCPSPNALTATLVTTTGATLGYNATGAGTYTIKYGPQGFNPATGGTAVTQTVAAAGPSTAALTGLQPGTTYQFYVQRTCAGTLGNSVNVGPVAFTTVIVNDEPCGATTLPLNLNGCQPYATTSAGATTSAPNGYTNPTAGCGIGGIPRDVWFKFTTAASGVGSTDARIAVTGGAASVVQALSATSCNGPFTFIRCAGTSNGVAAPKLNLPNLLPNTTYYVRVFGYSLASQPGNFTICVTPLPTCPTPTAVAATNVTKNSADLTWTAGLGGVPPGSTYSVIYGPPGFNPNASGTAVGGISGTSLPLTNLASNTSYCFYVSLVCGGLNGNSAQVGPTCFQTLLESPGNDDPCGAAALTSGAANVAGTTVGATVSQQPGIAFPICTGAIVPRDVWYTVVTPPASVGTDSLIVNLSGTPAGAVRVYTAANCAAGPFALVACQGAAAPNTGFAGPVRFGNLLPGTTYYLAVSGFGSSDAPGVFNIRIRTVYVGPTCNPVTGVAAGSLTTTSASIGFVPGTNNTSYTLTYGAAGVPATTLTPTASPVALTGLLPGTAYTVTVTPTCANGGSATGTSITFSTVAPTCNGVTNLAAGSLTPNSAVLNFTPGAGNTSYTVTYTAGGPTNTVLPAPTASPVLLPNLLPGTTYTATVRPVCSGGGMAPASTVTFSTPVPVCNAVTGVAVTGITSFTASAGFVPGTGNTSYNVTYQALPAGATVVVTGSTAPVALTGLTAGTSYSLTVTPTCAGGGMASASAPVTFMTPAAPCAPVTQLAATGVTPTAASLGFVAGTGNTSYTVTYGPTGSPGTTVTTMAPPLALTGLTPGTNYTVSVVSTCAAGGTAPAAVITFNTPPVCNGVTGLAATGITQTGASVAFVPGTNNTSYVVTFQAMGGVVRTVTPAPTASPVALPLLVANTAYTVTVTPVCAGGGLAPASTTTFTTPAPVCNPVTNLAATNLTPTSASVGFVAGTGNLSYSITYAPISGGTVLTTTGTAAPIALTGLTPNTPYTLTLTPQCAAGTAAPSSTITFTTPALPLTCNPVTQVAVMSITPTSASVGFVAGTGNQSFVVTYVPTAGGASLTASGPASPIALTGLLPNTPYTVTVGATCTNGAMAPGTTAAFRTLLVARAAMGQGLLTLAPNPARHRAVLTVPALTSARAATLTLLNPLGQVLQQQALTLAASGTQVPLDLHGLPAGVYLVQLQTGGEQAVVRLLVE